MRKILISIEAEYTEAILDCAKVVELAAAAPVPPRMTSWSTMWRSSAAAV